MTERRLFVRSSRARDLAHYLARLENRAVAEIVERALEAYAASEARREAASVFYHKLAELSGSDLDLEEIIRVERRPHAGLDL